MKQFAATLLGLVTAVLVVPGNAIAQDQPQTAQLVEGNAQLDSSVTTKSAKQGDVVTANLASTVKTSQGVELPHGTKLIGHVDQVVASNGKGASKLVLTFDKAQLKNGKEVAIKATIAGVAPSDGTVDIPSTVASDATFDQLPGSFGGVSLHSAVKEDDSGTLTGDHHDVHLSRGTQMLIALAPQAESASAQGGAQ
jgi:hypothetical protein